MKLPSTHSDAQTDHPCDSTTHTTYQLSLSKVRDIPCHTITHCCASLKEILGRYDGLREGHGGSLMIEGEGHSPVHVNDEEGVEEGKCMRLIQ